MQPRRAFRIGAAGALITALCCFTPLLAIALASLGLGALIVYLDRVLWPLLAASLGVMALAWLRMRRAPGPGLASDRSADRSALTLITFTGCPNAGRARDALRRAGRPFREVNQDDLPAGHPLRGYTSPSILAGERLIFGAASGEAGCSIAPMDAEGLLAALRTLGPA